VSPRRWQPSLPLAAVAAVIAAGLLAAAGILAGPWPGPGQRAHQDAPGAAPAAPAGRPVTVPWARRWPSYLPDPRHRMLLGAFTALSGVPSQEAAIEQREAAMGRRYDLEVTYYNWNDPFPDFGEATIAAHGRTPVMTWYGPGKSPGDHRTLALINSGRADAWITRQAEAIKRFGHRIYLRLMPEMNGTWYRGYSGKPAAFIAAWRRIHRLFRRAGASNVVWVWNPNLTPPDWDRYYPGNAYVNVIGVDGFNNTAKWPHPSFAQMFGPFLAHFAGRKPLMIAEVATTSARGSAAAFINGMHSYLEHVAGPRYGTFAVCWFDSNTSDHYNWRVDQTPAAWRAWLALARDPYFGGPEPAVRGSRPRHLARAR
jgi:hypothetical protein